jgi:tetratricopeptide (TPR) repeat protein
MALHARYAEDGVDPADAEALAHHWWEAVGPPDAQWVWEAAPRLAPMRREAFRAHLAAGRRLEERNAYEESLEAYSRAVELADDAADIAAAEASVGRAYARQGRGDEAWEHRLRAIASFAEAGLVPTGELYADMLEIATLNWGYFTHLPDDAEVLRLLDEGERVARTSGDDVALARLLAERASFTDNLAGSDEMMRFVESPDAVRFADAAQRMGMLYVWNGKISRATELFQTVFERLVPAGGIINEPEGLMWYAVAALDAGDLARANKLADRLLEESARRSVHTRQHAYGVKALIQLAEGAWDSLNATTRDLTQLIEANPDTAFCLIGASAIGYGAIADILAGRGVPEHLDELIARMVDESVLIQTSTVMVPKVMAGENGVLAEGLRAYAPDLRLWDRARAWDASDLMPAIALTMMELWSELGPSLARLDEFAAGGGELAGAAAAAIREEEEAAGGGPAPTHDRLRALGYAGISELIRFRPRSETSTAQL